MTAKEQGLPELPIGEYFGVRQQDGGQPYYTLAQLRAYAKQYAAALASDTGERGVVAWISAGGGALDFVQHYPDDRPLTFDALRAQPAGGGGCDRHVPGYPCPVPASCRENGCSAVERRDYATASSVVQSGDASPAIKVPTAEQAVGEWQAALNVALNDDIEEVLRDFAEDPTGDNGVMVVREVMRVLRRTPAALTQPQPVEGLMSVRDHETPAMGLHKMLGTREGSLSRLDIDRVRVAIAALEATPPAQAAEAVDHWRLAVMSGVDVYDAMPAHHKARTSHENVSDTLDACAKLARAAIAAMSKGE